MPEQRAETIDFKNIDPHPFTQKNKGGVFLMTNPPVTDRFKLGRSPNSIVCAKYSA